jgi:hypothetical protein
MEPPKSHVSGFLQCSLCRGQISECLLMAGSRRGLILALSGLPPTTATGRRGSAFDYSGATSLLTNMDTGISARANGADHERTTSRKYEISVPRVAAAMRLRHASHRGFVFLRQQSHLGRHAGPHRIETGTAEDLTRRPGSLQQWT